MQPEREFDSNKRKQMKINENKIAFFYLRLFFRIGTFNGLHRIQIEFFLALSGTRSGCIGAERTLPVAPRRGRRAFGNRVWHRR
jgi:hypothetical protein